MIAPKAAKNRKGRFFQRGRTLINPPTAFLLAADGCGIQRRITAKICRGKRRRFGGGGFGVALDDRVREALFGW